MILPELARGGGHPPGGGGAGAGYPESSVMEAI